MCPWASRKNELEVRNSWGNIVRTMQIRENSNSETIGYTREVGVDIQNHVTEFTLNKEMYYVDWFKIISGEGGHLWKVPGEHTTQGRTAFSGGRETIISSGNTLTCYETLTGRLVWQRKLRDRARRVVSQGSTATAWSEKGMHFKTVQSATGRLVRMIKSKRYVVTTSMADKFVMSYPIRRGELSADEEKAIVGPGGVKNPAKVATKYAVFDASKGELVWERMFGLASLVQFGGREIYSLTQEGNLSFIDIESGVATDEINIPLSDSQKEALEGINIRPHGAGWVLHVQCKERGGRFKRGKSTYSYESLHQSIGTGPVFLLDESRKDLLWQFPVYLERMEYLNNQPFDSPVIMFGRHVKRQHSSNGESHHMQTLQLDAKTGVLLGNHCLPTLESYDGHAIEWKRESGQASRTLVISTPMQIQQIVFDSSAELPPLPPTYITFNAMDFFDDPVFEQPKGSVVDLRVEEFRQRALDAEKVRTEMRDKSAAELKKRMTGTR